VLITLLFYGEYNTKNMGEGESYLKDQGIDSFLICIKPVDVGNDTLLFANEPSYDSVGLWAKDQVNVIQDRHYQAELLQ
jgi:hypothetical protein